MKRVNWSLFESWTPELAWFLGVTWGDGNVYWKAERGNYRLSVAGSYWTVRRWAALLSPDCVPQEFKVSPGNYQAYVNSKELVSLFRDRYGVIGPKSDNLPWPEGMPESCVPHFLRGIWDSDGSLFFDRQKYPTAKLAMNAGDFVHHCMQVLSSRSNLRKGSGKNSRMFEFKVQGPEALRVAHYLYRGAPEHLRNEDRWEVYQRMVREDVTTYCACGAPARRQGKCNPCWYRDRPKKTGSSVLCACGKFVVAKGQCTACYSRERRASGK